MMAVAAVFAASSPAGAEPLPAGLAGAWRITRILPTPNTACWGLKEAAPLVGSTLVYSQRSLRWKGGTVPVSDVFTRQVTAQAFERESGQPFVTFAQLGIHTAAVTETDFQHEDMDITGASTEVPGDAVLMVGPGRIVVSACGVYMEAVRAGARR